jgi:hypothetical protein
LCKLVADPAPRSKIVETIFREKDGLGSDSIKVLQQLTDGTLFVGTKTGLSATLADLAKSCRGPSAHSHGAYNEKAETEKWLR